MLKKVLMSAGKKAFRPNNSKSGFQTFFLIKLIHHYKIEIELKRQCFDGLKIL